VIRERILSDLTAAMKAKDAARLDALRMVKTAMQRQEIEDRAPLDDAGMIALLGKLVKQRQESAEAFAKGGRVEMAEKEKMEMTLLESYLPQAVGEAEAAAVVESALAAMPNATAKDAGAVMKAVMAKFAGQRVDGKMINALVRSRLGA
jgi:hypothetical protein